jgi:hypothetical protein
MSITRSKRARPLSAEELVLEALQEYRTPHQDGEGPQQQHQHEALSPGRQAF